MKCLLPVHPHLGHKLDGSLRDQHSPDGVLNLGLNTRSRVERVRTSRQPILSAITVVYVVAPDVKQCAQGRIPSGDEDAVTRASGWENAGIVTPRLAGDNVPTANRLFQLRSDCWVNIDESVRIVSHLSTGSII